MVIFHFAGCRVFSWLHNILIPSDAGNLHRRDHPGLLGECTPDHQSGDFN